MERIILKLSGQALSSNGKILDHNKMVSIAQEVKKLHEEGYEIGIVIGAGNIWRGRDSEFNQMDRVTADYIGMLGTVINSMGFADVLHELGLKACVLSAIEMPTLHKTYSIQNAIEEFKNGSIVIFGAGTGKPYCSTDTCAALRAKELDIHTILMAKNGTDGVYNDDPRKNPNATKFTKLSYQEMLDKNLGVMDLGAATISTEAKIKTIVFDMNVEGNIVKAIKHPEIGTIVE